MRLHRRNCVVVIGVSDSQTIKPKLGYYLSIWSFNRLNEREEVAVSKHRGSARGMGGGESFDRI